MVKMMKITGILFLVLIASYLGAHYWIRWKNTVHDDVTKISRLVDCEPNDVRYLSIFQSTEGRVEELGFARTDTISPGTPSVVAFGESSWRYLSPFKGEADATLLRRLASTLCELYDPVLLRPEDMKYAPPGKRVASKLVFGLGGKLGARAITFDLGAVGPDKLNFVLFTQDSKERVAKIPERFLMAASLPPEDFRSLQAMKIAADNVQVAKLKVDGKERFTLERAGAGWRVLLGEKELGQGSEEAARYINRLATLKALEVLEPEHSSQQCAAGKARAVLEVKGVANREESLRFDYGRGGDVSVCSTARTMKLRVHRDLLKYLDVPAKRLLAK